MRRREFIAGLGGAAAWRLQRYRVALEHASQAARLTAFLVALALPSIVFYPSLVDAAGRAHRQLVESRFAPEVVNQRRIGVHLGGIELRRRSVQSCRLLAKNSTLTSQVS